MQILSSSIAGLVPLVGALAVVYQGVARLRLNRGRAPYEPPTAIEPPAPATRKRVKAPLPDRLCEHCGTTIPGTEKVCTPCALERATPVNHHMALNWLVFLVAMGLVFGVGLYFAP